MWFYAYGFICGCISQGKSHFSVAELQKIAVIYIIKIIISRILIRTLKYT